MNRLEDLLRDHFPDRLRNEGPILRITPAIPLFVLVGALFIDPKKIESRALQLSTSDMTTQEDETETMESWVLETVGTRITELACYEYAHWLGETKAIQVFMAQVDDSTLLGVHTDESSPSWLIDGLASSQAGIATYLGGLELPPENLLRIVNAQPALLESEKLALALRST